MCNEGVSLRPQQPNHVVEAYDHHFQFFDRSIHTKVTNSRHFVDKWLLPLFGLLEEINKSNFKAGRVLVVGFSLQIADAAVAAIHLCYDDNCLIYHKPREESMPLSLSKFLSSPKCVFVGFGVEKPQLDILKREVVSHSFYIPYHYQCLISLAKHIIYYPTPADLSLLTNIVLQNLDVVRPQPDGFLEQIEYASIGVYVSRNVGKLLWEASMYHRQPRRAYFIKSIKANDPIQQVYNEFRLFDKAIFTIVTDSHIVVENWLADVIDDRHLYDYVGFDVQLYTLNYRQYISAVEFCVDTRCLVINFSLMNGRFFPKLEHFLVLDNNTFVGVDIQRKMKMLIDNLFFEYGGPLKVIDLRINAAITLGRPELRNASMSTLARQLLGPDLERPQDAQRQYARIDSAVSYEIAKRLLPGP